jgi:pentose-5-phosphate-3-epimerase
MSCPKLSDSEIEQFASSRSVAEEVIKQIAENRRWLRNYPVVIALAMNPKTPVYTAKSILVRLNYRDRMRVSRDRNLNPVTRQIATKLLDTRR